MDNKYVSTELIDEMAKVKDDFKILPKDIIEGMLEVILCQEKVQIKNDFFPSCQHT